MKGSSVSDLQRLGRRLTANYTQDHGVALGKVFMSNRSVVSFCVDIFSFLLSTVRVETRRE